MPKAAGPDMSEHDAQLAALVELHRGLDRQGPGDTAFSRKLLAHLPPLPQPPRVADLGCGSGVATLMLAEHFGTTVRAVDLTRAFLDELAQRADARGLRDRVAIIEADMGNLPWPPASLDLLWSEGAAYLPTRAWWDDCYLPLRRRIRRLAPTADAVMAGVIAEIEAEMALFEHHHDAYGYTFYLLEAR